MELEMQLSTRKLKRKYLQALRKSWKCEKKIADSQYSNTYDPYRRLKNLRKEKEYWNEWATDSRKELARRGMWVA